MVRPTLKKQKPNLQEAIKETAWKQIAETGAATLSLRSIARELGITAPAIYNYHPDRDALVTALIVDAYTSLGESQQAAIDALPADDQKKRLLRFGHCLPRMGGHISPTLFAHLWHTYPELCRTCKHHHACRCLCHCPIEKYIASLALKRTIEIKPSSCHDASTGIHARSVEKLWR